MNEEDVRSAENPRISLIPARNLNGYAVNGLILIGLYICYRFSLPFLPPLVWALTLAIVFLPFHRRIEHRIHRANLASAFSVLVIALIVVLPAVFVIDRFIYEISRAANALSGDFLKNIEHQPLLAPIARWIERQSNLPDTVGRMASALAETTATIVRGSVTQFIGLLVTFYMLFYFLRDRQLALDWLRCHSPLSSLEMDRLFTRVGDTVHATVFGTLTVAAIQGLLGGLMFWFLGLPAPLLWGIVMALLAVIPVLGAFIVWIPAALWLASQGDWGKALILTAWGGIVVAGIDNLIYPILVGNRLQQHTVVTFIALVGGLMLVGSSGIILGPLVVTLTLLLLEIRRERQEAASGSKDSG